MKKTPSKATDTFIQSVLSKYSGQKFGYLTLQSHDAGRKFWFVCDCGKRASILIYSLFRKTPTTSCGCRTRRGPSNPTWKGYEQITGEYWYRCVKQAAARGYEFTLTQKEAWDKYVSQDKRCALSGLPLSFSARDRSKTENQVSQTASLDRIDSAKGYSFDNVQWVHKDVNHAKCQMSDDAFIELCKNVATFRA